MRCWIISAIAGCGTSAKEMIVLRPMPVVVRPLEDYRLYIVFDNGEKGTFDMKPYIKDFSLYEPLKDVSVFRTVSIASDHVVEWTNGADISPDDLYDLYIKE